MFIFIDESGDTGNGEKSSRHFLLAAVICRNQKPLIKLVSSIRRRLQKKYRNIHELHAYRSPDTLRRQVVRKLVDIPGIELAVFIFKKSKQKKEKQSFYISCASQAIVALFHHYEATSISPLEILFDQRDTKRSLREELIQTIKNTISENVSAKVSVVPSYASAGIQVVDFIAWAIFRKYEHRNTEYYDIIKDYLVIEKIL